MWRGEANRATDGPFADAVEDGIVSKEKVQRGTLIALPEELGRAPDSILGDAPLPLVVEVAHCSETLLMTRRVGCWETAGLVECIDGGLGAEAPLEVVEWFLQIGD